MCKNCFVGGVILGRIRVFILHEHNEKVVMGIFKVEELFGIYFFLIYMH